MGLFLIIKSFFCADLTQSSFEVMYRIVKMIQFLITESKGQVNSINDTFVISKTFYHLKTF